MHPSLFRSRRSALERHVRSLAAAGYSKLTPRDVARLAMAGVNADFIREMSKYRDKK